MDRVAADPLERLLRRLALNDDRVVGAVLDDERGDRSFPALDPKTSALVRLGALISLGAPTTCYRYAVEVAYAAGATDEEILGVLSAVGPAAGAARAVAAAPGLALALGYDVEEDLT
ncbi:MAG TPA: carboxymuconolactone decarboxylase family protein [Thermoleophilaceae bacterium]|nr:carboxymuconolactone decarboxylase family protein [Thermoleophilaceae bacterium]